MNKAADNMEEVMKKFEKMIAAAPDGPEEEKETTPPPRDISYSTGVPKRYRPEWDHPTDAAWQGNFAKVMKGIPTGSIVGLIGKRGTGKTRLAAEAIRSYSPDHSAYTTAMGLFLRIQNTYGDSKTETQADIVGELSRCTALVIDEVQERGNSEWEDRLLTHIIDNRYGAKLPTVIIANLEAAAMKQCLGDSISSRINETGGIIEITGKSFRE